jgi:pimeloyl-ACP methyl ester carboxylesterase
MRSKYFLKLILVSAVLAVSTTYAQPTANKFTEREVSFAGVGGLQLRGALVLPASAKGKVPGVLLLPGSGPVDRDGNAPPIITTVLKQIAERLASDGYASLRFDKRATSGYASSWPTDPGALDEFFSWDKFVGDALGGLAFLQNQREINSKQVLIAGHSEGAMIAIQIAHDLEGKSNAPAGLILLSSPGRPGGQVITEQIDASLKRANITGEKAKTYRDSLQLAISQISKDGTVPPNMPADLAGLFGAGSIKLWQAELAFDPPKVLSVYSGPVLLIQGEKDIQSSAVNDFPLLQSALKQCKRGTYKAIVILSTSHNLKHVENENLDPAFKGPVVPQVLDTISDWLKQTLKR